MTTEAEDKEEALRLLVSVGPSRAASLGDEMKWALGAPVCSSFTKPPTWVRSLILCLLGVDEKHLKQSGQLSQEYFAKLAGAAQAMIEGVGIAISQPPDVSDIKEQYRPAALEFEKNLARAIQPTIDEGNLALGKIPEDAFKKSPSDFAAFTKGQSEGAEFIAKCADENEPDQSVTVQLYGFLWIFWPQVQTAKSVRELHDWITRLRYAQCSLKLIEKICAQIEFRPSARGRKKRIPTT